MPHIKLGTHPALSCVEPCFLSTKRQSFISGDYGHPQLRTPIKSIAYAVMSNHYHVVLHINREQALSWSEFEVVEHWHRLFKGSLLSQRFYQGEALSKAELNALSEQVCEWRIRLMSISWFMRCTNEPIAREANHEDEATGHFWAAPAHPCAHGTCASLHIGGRFKSQALLDEKALAACMVYVDLNPIRARMAESPEQSDRYCQLK